MPNPLEKHTLYMEYALEEAKKAFSLDEVPVGAVIIHDEKVIGRGFNQRERLQSPIAHAEIFAIEEAAKNIGSWRLLDATLYATMEPCAMCAGAIVLARIKTVVFSVRDAKGGACGTVFNITQEPRLNHSVEIIEGILEQDSRELIQTFFKQKRQRKKNIQQTERCQSG